MYDNIDITEDAGIITITLNRPDKLNAMVGHMRRDLAEALEQAGSDRSVRVVVITGAGRGFCAGGDLERAAQLIEEGNGEEFSRLLGAARRVVTAIRQMTKPVIASVNGPATIQPAGMMAGFGPPVDRFMARSRQTKSTQRVLNARVDESENVIAEQYLTRSPLRPRKKNANAYADASRRVCRPSQVRHRRSTFRARTWQAPGPSGRR